MIITRESHPAIFDAFRRIDLDNGGINRWNPKPTEYTVPDCFSGQLPQFEQQLAAMTEDQRETFCNGEYSDQKAVAESLGGLADLDEFLNRYFDGWIADAEDGR